MPLQLREVPTHRRSAGASRSTKRKATATFVVGIGIRYIDRLDQLHKKMSEILNRPGSGPAKVLILP